MVEYKDRLAEAMRHAGIDTTRLADAIKLTYQGVKRVLDGKSSAFTAANNSYAARVLGVDPDWLATGEGQMVSTADRTVVLSSGGDTQDGYVRLPVLAEASAGPGREALPEVVQYVDVFEGYIRQRLNANPHTLKVLTARGSSMTGDIEDGDVMFVLPTNEFTDDGIYVLTLDSLIRVKRLTVSMTSGNVIIESNDGRKAEELPLKEVPHRLHIQGRVIGAWSLRSFN